MKQYENESLVACGSSLLLPLPFDNLPESLFSLFLHLLYDEENFKATEKEWHALKRLGTEWQFTHQTRVAVWAIVSIRERQLPLPHRGLLGGFMVRRVLDERNRRRQEYRRLRAMMTEDSDEEDFDEVVSDDSV